MGLSRIEGLACRFWCIFGANVDHILQGKQYNRGMQCLTLIYEALMQMWLMREDLFKTIPTIILTQLQEAHRSFLQKEGVTPQVVIRELERLIEEHIMPLIDQYKTSSYASSPIFKYYDMLLQAIQILLFSSRAQRCGNWSLYKQSQAAMLPYFYSANQSNYSRRIHIHIINMEVLPTEILEACENGDFVLRQRPGMYNGIAADMGTEKTEIKDSKGCGGIGGITHTKKEPCSDGV